MTLASDLVLLILHHTFPFFPILTTSYNLQRHVMVVLYYAGDARHDNKV